MRSKHYIIDDSIKDRIVNFLNTYYKSAISIYLGGSHSTKSIRYPSKNSDIDIYVVYTDISLPIALDQKCTDLITLGIGRNISIYLVNPEFSNSICVDMDLLFEHKDI